MVLIDNNYNNNLAIRSPGTPLTKYNKNRKFALEFIKYETAVQIENLFDGDRKVYLTYMTTYPDKLYPKVSVFIARNLADSEVVIDPIAGYDFPGKSHYSI